MIVKCITNECVNLFAETILPVGQIKKRKYQIEIGTEHIVYGIFSTDGRSSYLLTDKHNFPFWYPAELFEIIDSLLPPTTRISFKKYKRYDDKDSTATIIGYKEMTLDFDHHDDLIELKRETLEIFYKRKAEIDEFEELRTSSAKANK